MDLKNYLYPALLVLGLLALIYVISFVVNVFNGDPENFIEETEYLDEGKAFQKTEATGEEESLLKECQPLGINELDDFQEGPSVVTDMISGLVVEDSSDKLSLLVFTEEAGKEKYFVSDFIKDEEVVYAYASYPDINNTCASVYVDDQYIAKLVVEQGVLDRAISALEDSGVLYSPPPAVYLGAMDLIYSAVNETGSVGAVDLSSVDFSGILR